MNDPTGAVIPGVEVTVTNAATGATRLVVTNETGTYFVSQLPPGTYDVSASLPGFRTQLMSGVSLPLGETVIVNLALEVGAITDVVGVIASVDAVNTVDAKLGVGFDTRKIIDLPLNARNIVACWAYKRACRSPIRPATSSAGTTAARSTARGTTSRTSCWTA